MGLENPGGGSEDVSDVFLDFLYLAQLICL